MPNLHVRTIEGARRAFQELEQAWTINLDEERETEQTWAGQRVYRKVVTTGALPDATTKQVAHGITGLKRVVRFSGYAFRPLDGMNIPLPNGGCA